MPSALFALVLAAAVSPSKLGVVVAGDVTSTEAAQLLAACPRLAVFPLDGTNASTSVARVTAYRTACPGGIVAVELTGLGAAFTTVDGSMVPSWWPAWLQQIRTAGLGGRIDAIIGPSDLIGTNGSADVDAFWAAFVQTVASSGLSAQPVITAPGDVLGPSGQATSTFCNTVAAVQATGLSYAWSYRLRSSPILEPSLSFRCRPSGVPVYLTHVGPTRSAWQAGDVPTLAAFDTRVLQPDAGLVGAALSTLGGETDLSTISGPLATYLLDVTTPSNGGTPGGSTGGSVGPSPVSGGDLSSSSSRQGCATGGADASWVALVLLGLRVRRSRSRTATA